MDCFYSLMAFGAMLMALIALIKSSGFGEVREMHKRLRLEVEELRKRLLEAERLIAALRKGQLVPEKVEQVPAIKQEAIPIPVAPQPATPPPLPEIVPPPVLAPPASAPPPPVPAPQEAPVPAIPIPEIPAPIAAVPLSVAASAPVAPSVEKITHAAAPLQKPQPASLPPRPIPPLPARPLPAPRPRISLPEVQPVNTKTLEDFLGTQIFLKLGIAILVIGVVFAMGLVFQKVGPLGKVLMGYAGGLALLFAGLYAEKRERYVTFGRTLIAGAWGILYFVTFAAGFIEPSKIFTERVSALSALILAAAAAVGFSLKYRNEWTTTSAFLLIFLSLGIAAFDTHPAFNLAATLVVAIAMTLLIWRTGWMRLLGLGVPATWICLGIWILREPGGQGGMHVLISLACCWVAFQIATLGQEDDDSRRPWQAFAQVANFMGALGLTLTLSQPQGTAWMWALGYGLAHLGVAWLFYRRGSRGLYLLVATEGIAALALVSPLRLGLHNQLTPLLRLMGIELLLAAGVFLKERYFRVMAYGAFLLTACEILIFRMDPALGQGRLVLLGAASAAFLLNATLIRTWWSEACEAELPGMAYTFTSLGTLQLFVFLILKVSPEWMGASFSALALVWMALGMRRGLKDLLVQGSLLGAASLVSLWAATEGVDPGTRLKASILAAGGLVLAYTATRVEQERTLGWASKLSGLFSLFVSLSIVLVLLRECPRGVVPSALGGFGLLLLLLTLSLGFRELFWQSVIVLAITLGTLLSHRPSGDGRILHLSLRAWSILSVALAVMIQEGLLRIRSWARESLTEREQDHCVWLTTLLGAGLLGAVIFLEAPPAWAAPMASLLALLLLCRALALRQKEHVVAASTVSVAALLALVTLSFHVTGSSGPFSLRGLSFGLCALGFLLQEILMRSAKERWPWMEGSWEALVALLSHAASLLLVLVVFLDVPVAWIAPVLSAFSLAHLGVGLGLKLKDHLLVAIWASLCVVLSLITCSPMATGHLWHIPLRTLSLFLPALGFLVQETLLRRMESRWPWSDGARRLIGDVWGILGATILAVLVFMEVPALWVPGTLMALGLLWMLWSRWRASLLHCVEALGFCLLGLMAIATSAWPLAGQWHGLPQRSVSALTALFLAYVIQHLLHRSQHEKHPDRMLLSDLLGPQALGAIAAGLLLLLSLGLGFLIKVECLAHDKNLLVALAWGLLGVLYLERGRGLRDWKWILYGHVGLMAALVHFLAVNLVQPGSLGGLSLRLITGLPFLGLLSYAYLNWQELDFVAQAPGRAASWRPLYLYGIQLAIATLLLYEGHRAWVLPLWALQALVCLVWGLRKENAHWLRCALILVIACAFRGIGTNLYFRDQAAGLALNLVTVPGAALLILVGYILLRRRLEGEARLELHGLGAGINRMPWLLVQTILLFGFIWVEVSGRELTVWLSGLGLGMVTLGFVFQERLARLLGLGLLSACIIKLFAYDLRGLGGLHKVLSFIVLGTVLVVVSFVYTRFKERLEKLL